MLFSFVRIEVHHCFMLFVSTVIEVQRWQYGNGINGINEMMRNWDINYNHLAIELLAKYFNSHNRTGQKKEDWRKGSIS